MTLPMRRTERGSYQYEIAPGQWVSRQRLHQLRNPLREQARIIVTAAIAAGTLRRNPCEACGQWASEAHHDDYAQPLVIRWLCPTHHRRADAEQRKREARPSNESAPTADMPAKDPNAVALGRKGGLAGKGRTSPAKTASSRKNGMKGGRPTRVTSTPPE